MSDTGESPNAHEAQADPIPRGDRGGSADLVHRACPYLVAADGFWRGSQPTREHRCGATQPQAAPAITKQRDLCLTARHVGCATFVAGQAIEAGRASAVLAPGSGFWPETRSTVLALEPGHGRPAPFRGSSRKGGGQALLVGLMVLAFLVLVIARTASPPGSGATPSFAAGGAALPSPVEPRPSPSIAVSEAPSASVEVPASAPAVGPSPSPTPAPTPTPTPAPTQTATASAPPPSASATPAAGRGYQVRSGDTLYTIAIQFGTSVNKIKVANGLTSNTIRPGQVLVIP